MPEQTARLLAIAVADAFVSASRSLQEKAQTLPSDQPEAQAALTAAYLMYAVGLVITKIDERGLFLAL